MSEHELPQQLSDKQLGEMDARRSATSQYIGTLTYRMTPTEQAMVAVLWSDGDRADLEGKMNELCKAERQTTMVGKTAINHS